MRVFLWAMLIVCVADVFGRFIRLAKQDFTRTPLEEAANGVCNTLILMWIVSLLVIP